MTKEFKDIIADGINDFSLSLTDEQISKLYRYYELLIEWNKVMNLTAITEMKDVAVKHFVDSLSLVKAIGDLGDKNYSCIDVGTGAGFPGIPLKIAFPNLKITLIDSLNKRIKFLNTVCEELGLTDVFTVHGRAEDFGRDANYRESFDLCFSRAVANLSTLSEYCIPFIKVNGYFIPYKSGKVDEELVIGESAIEKLGSVIEDKYSFLLPGTDAERSLVVIRKVKKLSDKYPRKAGLPSKEPLN